MKRSRLREFKTESLRWPGEVARQDSTGRSRQKSAYKAARAAGLLYARSNFRPASTANQHKHQLTISHPTAPQDGRHFAGMTVLHGVPMVASSPVQYDDHSTLSAGTPGQQPASGNPNTGAGRMLELQTASQQQQQQQQQEEEAAGGHYGEPHSPASVDIHGYQPPWKNLLEYAHQHQQQQAPGSGPAEARLNPASPRYQQLMGQVSVFITPNPYRASDRILACDIPPARTLISDWKVAFCGTERCGE